ncbi:MAG TPA: phosphatase PAP2 family protein [Arcobacter sp.]|nr:phosphatase PAP2 family protein [Arcobacter sp.]
MSIHHLLEQFYSWVLSYPSMTILLIVATILFIASIVESIPFAGMFFPSETLTVFFGMMAYKGIVNIEVLILVAFIGLFIGDEIGYKIGQKLGKDYIKHHAKKLKVDENRYQSIEKSLDNNLFKILLIARSNGFTRWLVPFVAGANGIDYKKFTLANVFTAAFWSPAFLLGGYFLGNAFELYGKYLGIGILLAVIISFFLYIAYQYIDKKGYLKRDDFKLLIVGIIGISVFLKMYEDVTDLEYITKIDIWIHTHISQLYNPFLTKVMVIVTSVDNIIPITIITILITLYLLYKKHYKDMLFLIISIAGASSLMSIIKNTVERIRPDMQIIEVLGYSFPSGHATISTALAFSLFWILKEKIKYTKTLLFVAIILPLLISFSRVYLNVHYLSDVVAGIGLSLFWVSLVAIIFDIRKKSETKI